jgi:uncharacterized protein YodC (DUF2158 family)
MTNATGTVGEIVQLKSGGPAMTVTMTPPNSAGQVAEGWVECMWFDNTVAMSENFPVAALQKHG